jgi:DNA-binding ferritin-like protein
MMVMSKGRLERYERLRDLAKRIVDDPRSVDAATKAALKTATLKYVATKYDDTTQALKALYRDEGELGSLLRKAVEIVDDIATPATMPIATTTRAKTRFAHRLATTTMPRRLPICCMNLVASEAAARRWRGC